MSGAVEAKTSTAMSTGFSRSDAGRGSSVSRLRFRHPAEDAAELAGLDDEPALDAPRLDRACD